MDDIVQIHDLRFKKYITSEEIQVKVEDIAQRISKKYQDQCPLFLGVLNGAFIFVSDLVRACHIPLEVSFIKLSSYKGVASTGKVASVIGLNVAVENRPVILVEDIVDSGETMHQFMPYLKSLNPASVELAAIFVKPDALKRDVKIDYVGFEIPDKFIVGYGLDYDQRGRELPDVYQLFQELQ